MKLAMISDLHGSLPPIPDCDLMVVAGDICGGPDHVDGRWRPDKSDKYWRDWFWTDFCAWTRDIPTFITLGNHDTALVDLKPSDFKRNITYLNGEHMVEFAGLKFWGAPWTTYWDGLAFNISRDEIAEKWKLMPPDIDVAVCHQPPYDCGDDVGGRHVGCRHLALAVERCSPKLLVCGHIHQARGKYMLGSTVVVNTACGFSTVEV